MDIEKQTPPPTPEKELSPEQQRVAALSEAAQKVIEFNNPDIVELEDGSTTRTVVDKFATHPWEARLIEKTSPDGTKKYEYHAVDWDSANPPENSLPLMPIDYWTEDGEDFDRWFNTNNEKHIADYNAKVPPIDGTLRRIIRLGDPDEARELLKIPKKTVVQRLLGKFGVRSAK